MILIRDLQKRQKIKNPVVTIGNFDGVHIGHQKIFQTLIKKAHEIKGTPTVITFNPHPMKVLAPEKNIKMITTLEDKLTMIRSQGIGAIVIIDFNKEFAATEAEDFIEDILVSRLGVKAVIVGHGYVFGRFKRGNTYLLRRLGKQHGFGVNVIRYKRLKQNVASSSRIRSLIAKGKVAEASSLLGRAYHINGRVVKGTGRGKTILNIPTANIKSSNDIIPHEGVYAARVSLLDTNKERIYNAVANIGLNPTFGNKYISCETHLLNFTGDLLNREIRLHFIKRIREERRFDSPALLREQIISDIEIATKILQSDRSALF